MEKILNSCFSLLSTAIASISLFMVDISMGTMSAVGIYEPEMPDALRPADEDEEAE